VPADHHSEYLSSTLEALTPDGRRRVDELLDELTQAAGSRPAVLRLAQVLRGEADEGKLETPDPDPGLELSPDELDRLMTGFTVIRDGEPLDDVGDWANAVLQLLEDEAERHR
jgi:hypothetical protein